MQGTLNRLRLLAIGAVLVVIYLVFRFGVGIYTDYLWFRHIDLESVFLIGFWAKIWVGLAVAVPFVALFWANSFIARWLSIRNVIFFSEEVLVAQKFVGWGIWVVGLFLAWLVSAAASNQWLLFLRYFNRQPFNRADPIFNQDVGFYIFSLPVYNFIQVWLVISLFLSLIGAVIVYGLAQQKVLSEGRIPPIPAIQQLHLAIIGGLIFLTFALGHWLSLFELMYSPRGVAFGASYTDINVSIPALWTMVIVAIAVAIALPINIVFRRPQLSLLTVGVWLVVNIVGTGLIPALVQRYIVEPNELTRETPYIEHNIRLTNIAYGLDAVIERDFSQVAPLENKNLTNNEIVLKNLRLWDYRPLRQTYQQLQAIRLYYQFVDIDLDRYIIDDELRQVALSGRELDKRQLQSPTWVNQKLQFTHGYGVVVNPVNEVTADGLPRLWVKDLPPTSTISLSVERPEIYYGEATGDYVFVHTEEREFDYPSGDENVYSAYEGEGGVVLSNFLKRLAFALRLSDVNVLLSQDFTVDTRVMIYRNIRSRVQKIAPFLRYDHDPYIVIGPDGHLYWIQDAYTVSDRFPYAEPHQNLNYIRNSVKVVIDAYDGSLTFYTIDPEDPLLQTYDTIFPTLFTSFEEIPDWLQAHLRYPEDLFRIQTDMYQTYHMRDVNVFYNKEDQWQVPFETFSGNKQPVEPYYVVLKLPGGERPEFALIQPFTPNNKDNLIAWLAARSDAPHYGELVSYRFPKQELIFGPLQIEGRIDQHPDISSQITLWDQGGSEVIRGNLLVLPIDNSLIYVEPLYLRAENGQIPELKRVILASGEQIVMQPTLAEALTVLFEGKGEAVPPPQAATTEEGQQPLPGNIEALALRASEHYEAAQAALQNGDWTTYGQEMDQVKAAIDELVRLTGGPAEEE